MKSQGQGTNPNATREPVDKSDGQGMVEGVDGTARDAEAQGRDAVRRLLWDRLDDAGMQRGRGVTADKDAKMRARLTDRLAYMDPENLRTLADALIDVGSGAKGDRLASEAVILAMGRGLQAEPVERRRIVTSWMASIEGPIAIAGGYDVALYRWLRAYGRPPTPFDLSQIKDRASDERRRFQIVGERIGRGVAGDDDLSWQAAYLRDRAEVQQIVEAAAQRRAVSA